MASKGKQRKKNAFGYFLDDYVKEQHAAGRKISHTIGAEECALIWEKMSPEEKKVYSEKAAVFRVYTQKEKETKFTSYLVSFADIDRKQQEAENKIDRCNREIKSTIGKLNLDTIRKHLFYTIHCHYLVKTEDGIYMPGEIAICEFSLEDGIRNTYHRLINSGPLPLGFGLEAKRRREGVHNLPIPPYEDGVSDYREILNDIFKFIEPGRLASGGRPPFYAAEEEITPIENILQQLSDKKGKGENFFRVFPIHRMFFALKNKCVELVNDETGGFPVLTNALTEIERDTYRYVSGISCEYHAPSDQFYHSCSLSIVQRYVYVICDHCCQYLGIPLKPGKHVRRNADVSEKEGDTSKRTVCRIKKEKHGDESSFVNQNRYGCLDEEFDSDFENDRNESDDSRWRTKDKGGKSKQNVKRKC